MNSDEKLFDFETMFDLKLSKRKKKYQMFKFLQTNRFILGIYLYIFINKPILYHC